MKSITNKFLLVAGLLVLATLGLSQPLMAQRFNHNAGGGGGGGNRGGSAPAPSFHAPAARPAPTPVARLQINRPAPEPMRTEQRPAMPSPTINGGGRNIGHHDFGINNPAPARPVGNNDGNANNGNGRNNGGNGNSGNGRNNGGNIGSNPRVAVNARVNIHDNVFHTGGYQGMHPYSYHPYRPSHWGPNWHPFGFFLGSLAANAFRFSVANQYYYYDDGNYYIPSGSGYSSVPPPIGAVVSYLPDGYESTMVGNDTFYYYAGAFYVAVDQGYQVVAAPVGAVVTQIPVGAVDQQINGEDILVYNNVYYAPISQDGEDAYQVVQGN